MKFHWRACFLIIAMASVPEAALAQAGAGAPLDDAQLLGRRLFTQSCGVCHGKPTINANPYGPVLSKESLGGQHDALVQVISNGTARMPGFRFTYSPDQISAIAAYLLTVPAPAPGAAKQIGPIQQVE